MSDALGPDFFTLDAAYRKLQAALLEYQNARRHWEATEFALSIAARSDLHESQYIKRLSDEAARAHTEFLRATDWLATARNEWAQFPIAVTYRFVHQVRKDLGYRTKLKLKKPLDGTI